MAWEVVALDPPSLRGGAGQSLVAFGKSFVRKLEQ